MVRVRLVAAAILGNGSWPCFVCVVICLDTTSLYVTTLTVCLCGTVGEMTSEMGR